MKMRVKVTNKFDRPLDRLLSILGRLSRDRFIPPIEFRVLCNKIARSLVWRGGARSQVLNNERIQICQVVGMLRGRPLLFPFEKGYRDLLFAVEFLDVAYDGVGVELAVLNALIKGMK
jgi:hypothetical protein